MSTHYFLSIEANINCLAFPAIPQHPRPAHLLRQSLYCPMKSRIATNVDDAICIQKPKSEATDMTATKRVMTFSGPVIVWSPMRT